jgi:uncharacterized protein (DUF488 family)
VPTLYTIGHSTRSFEALAAILAAQGIELLIDIRTLPRSRRHPHFNREQLESALPAAGIRYLHMPALGGLRHPRKDSINSAWKNDSFRGYADYMQTPEFAQAIADLLDLASGARTAIMCAEAVEWRCHRSLVADALAARGVEVLHIQDEKRTRAHRVTAFARIEATRVTYPGLL